MPSYLDLATWSRRDLFEFFHSYERPHFNICARVDITDLLNQLRGRRDVSVMLAYHYFALRVANEIEPFRYRLKEGKVIVYEVINGGTTVLLPNDSFSYAYFDYQEDFKLFARSAGVAIKRVQTEGLLKPTMRDDLIYFTVLPWVSFTSFAHARTPGRGESVPRIAFGKFTNENDRIMLPISVEVHHALMDGLHVGRYLNRLQEVFSEPEKYVGESTA